MDNLQPLSNLDPSDVPAGFTMADPNQGSGSSAAAAATGGAAGASTDGGAEAHQKAILEQALTLEARARLRRIQLVKPAKASAVESVIYNLAVSGKLPGPVTEDKLIELLDSRNPRSAALAPSAQGTSSISIQRKKYAMDSDDDDNDDDLL